MKIERRLELRRAQLILDVEASVIREAWLAGASGFWERRAQELEAARPTRRDRSHGEVRFEDGHRAPEMVPDIDWSKNAGWPTIGPATRFFHHSRPLRLDEVPMRPAHPGPSASDVAGRHVALSEAAAACRARAQLVEQTDLELVDALRVIASPYEDLERQFRAALDAGDRHRIDRLARLIDQADLAEVA